MQCLFKDEYGRPSTVTSWSDGVGVACGGVVGSTEVLGEVLESSTDGTRVLNAMSLVTTEVFSSLGVQLDT